MDKINDDEVLAALHFLQSFNVGTKGLVRLVEERETLISSVNILSALPKNLLTRWADPNYG